MRQFHARAHFARVAITGFDNYGRPLVSYAGWQGFVVQPGEIISVERPK